MRLRLGIVLSLFAAVFWGLASVLLKPAITHFSLVQANAARMTMVAVALYLLRVLPSERQGLRAYDRRSFLVIAATGILGMGAGAWLFLYAINHAGVATAVTLNSSAPLFGVLFGTVFLKERLTLPMGLGMACCLLGVWVVL
jgi:drug/metabolite transporter (DMT)-like permease